MTDIAEDSIQSVNDDKSKDEYFQQLADLANRMIRQHGKEFTMGTLVLAARFIAEDKPLHIKSHKNDAAHQEH